MGIFEVPTFLIEVATRLHYPCILLSQKHFEILVYKPIQVSTQGVVVPHVIASRAKDTVYSISFSSDSLPDSHLFPH